MEVIVNFEKKGSYVLISSEGERKNFASIVDGTKKIYSIIEETKCRLALVDYRKVTFSVPQTDAFNAVRLYELKMPSLRDIKIAGVLNEDTVKIGQVWKEIAQSKGFLFEIFTDMDKAETWLLRE